MKKYYLILLVLLGLGLNTEAQKGSNVSKKEPVSIGIKGGLNMPRMLYFQNTALSQLPQEWMFTPTGGLFVEIPAGELLIISPEVMYVQRGLETRYIHNEHISGMQVHYLMNASYADIRLPFELHWAIKPYLQPYLVVGAETGVRLFGQIYIDRTAPAELDETIDVGDANLNLIHAGAFAGLGIRSRIDLGGFGMILKLSASFHQGLLDSYSKMEKEGIADPQNVNAYQITGSRLPQGIEVCLGIAIPLEPKQDDACASFSKDHRWIKHNKRGYFGY